MRKSSKIINDEYYHDKGYKNEDLNIRGKPKRGLASFQIEDKLWREFDQRIEKQHGKYKKCYIIENLIREYMTTISNNDEGTDYR